jgi:hypothetical protein
MDELDLQALKEIGKQLKRIADKLDSWECESSLGVYQTNSKKV